MLTVCESSHGDIGEKWTDLSSLLVISARQALSSHVPLTYYQLAAANCFCVCVHRSVPAIYRLSVMFCVFVRQENMSDRLCVCLCVGECKTWFSTFDYVHLLCSTTGTVAANRYRQTIWTLKTRAGGKKSKKVHSMNTGSFIFDIKLTLQVWITHHDMLLFTSWWSYQVKLSNLMTSTRNQCKPAMQFISVESMQLIKNLLWLSPSPSPPLSSKRVHSHMCVHVWPEEGSEMDHLKIWFSL